MTTRLRDVMSGATISVEVVLAELSTPILPNIGGESTREGLIELQPIFQWEYRICVVKNRRRPTQTTRADNDKR